MTSELVHRFVIAYDIADDSRRARVAKELESYGDRIQYSVFLVDAKPAKLVRIRASLRQLIDLDLDSAMICDLGPVGSRASRLEFVGRQRPYTGSGPLVL